LSIENPMSIAENSTIARDLCVILNTNSTLIQREVAVDIGGFIQNGFAQSGTMKFVDILWL